STEPCPTWSCQRANCCGCAPAGRLPLEVARSTPWAAAPSLVRSSRRRRWQQLDATRKLLADVETAGALAVVPVEAIPVRSVARPGWRALGTELHVARG